MKTALKLILISFTVSILLPYFSQKTEAASATLYSSPSFGTYYVGEQFNVLFYVSSPSQSTNSYDLKISASNLEIRGISDAGSICKLFPFPPSYTPSTANFICGLPTPGYKGGGGYIGSIIARGNSPGTGTVSIQGNSKVLANDGEGTNILSGTGSSSFTILPTPTGAPTVKSSTHPNQNKWYAKNDVKLSWDGNGNSFSYTLDKKAGTNPDEVSEGSEKTKEYSNRADGIWYFHVRVKGSGGWSNPTHFRIQVDTTAPLPFEIDANPKINADEPPLIGFQAIDKTSGIDHYELKVDEGKWLRVTHPYKISQISSGGHEIKVKAIDKAGNERISSLKITVKEIPIPVITSPTNGSFLPYSEELTIRGTAEPGFTVEIYLDDKKIGEAQADKNGRFKYVYKELLASGKHSLFAIAINSKNITSRPSEKINFTVDPRAIEFLQLTIPGTFVYISFILIILIFVFVLVLILLKSRKFKKKLKEIFEDLESQVGKDLESYRVGKKAETKVKEDIEETEEEVLGKK